MESLTGHFLLATNQMPDPRFFEQVVYICSHDQGGTMGLVINKPCGHTLDEVLNSANIPFRDKLFPPVYLGGPVDQESAFFLYSSEYKAESFLSLSETISMSRDPKILHAIGAGEGPKEYLFILGYAGWGPGQLEMELTLNGWLTLPGSDEILFRTADSLKWKKAAQQYGIDISLYSDQIGLA